MAPKERKRTILSVLEEAAIVSLKVQARLPLDDVYIALKDVIPHLSRSSLHRFLHRTAFATESSVSASKKSSGSWLKRILDDGAVFHNDAKVFVGIRQERKVFFWIAVDHKQVGKCTGCDGAELAAIGGSLARESKQFSI